MTLTKFGVVATGIPATPLGTIQCAGAGIRVPPLGAPMSHCRAGTSRVVRQAVASQVAFGSGGVRSIMAARSGGPIARAHAVGDTQEVPPTFRGQADREGWIALRSIALDLLVSSDER
jgi:hypothetical protein